MSLRHNEPARRDYFVFATHEFDSEFRATLRRQIKHRNSCVLRFMSCFGRIRVAVTIEAVLDEVRFNYDPIHHSDDNVQGSTRWRKK